MYNILLTDDEQIVVDSLSFIINKNFSDEVCIHTALSGTEALEIVTKEKIDIIFMDINMPGLSGLETVSCITKLKPDTIIIMLSAFDRFQYAQEAMNLGAFKYITKPVNRNVVIQTIRSAMDYIDNKRGLQSADQELHKKLDLVSPMIESDFIYACIYNNDTNFDYTSYLSYFNFTEIPWSFLCFEIPNINSDNQYKTYLRLREFLNSKHRCLVSSFMMNRIVVFFPIFSENYNQTEIFNQISQIYSELSFVISAGIRLGVSAIQSEWSAKNLKTSYHEALTALNKTDVKGGTFFAGNDDAPQPNFQQNYGEFKNQLLMRLKQGDSNGVKSFLELYTTKLCEAESNLNKIKNSFFEIIVTARNITLEINPNFYSESFDNAFAVLSSENDITMIRDYVQKTLFEYISAIVSIRSQADNPIIKKVCDYINTHLSEDISLEQMADYVKVSSFYLSKLFKEEKGITFVNFLSDKRLDEGKRLLSDTDLSIKEITAEIGYNDQNYFSRLFKNKFGISPTEWRGIK